MKTSKVGLLAILFLMAAMLTACGGSKSTETKATDEWGKIKERGTIIIGTSGTYFPMDYKDSKTNELTGFEVDIAKEFAKRNGLKVEFKTMEFDGILPALRNGQIDLASNNFTINEERKKKFDFTTPYKHSYGTIAVRSSDHSGIKSTEDFEGKKFGDSPTSNFADFARTNGAEIVAYTQGIDTILRDIAIGRIDGVLNDRLMLEIAVQKMNNDSIEILSDIKFQPNVGVMVMKKDSPELKKNIDKAINEMLDDGTIKELSMKYFGIDVTQEVDEKDIIQ